MLESDPSKGYIVPDTDELVDEAFLFIVAGTGSTSHTLSCAVYYILTHEEVSKALRVELSEFTKDGRDKLTWPLLSNLPYLVSN